LIAGLGAAIFSSHHEEASDVAAAHNSAGKKAKPRAKVAA
jgi:hypothetical protein